MKMVSVPESITHLHLLSVIVTETNRIHRTNPTLGLVRILDAGCGNGHFTSFIHSNLTAIFPGVVFEIYGYDVADHGVQVNDFFSKTLAWCTHKCPEVRWKERLRLITHDQNWPFDSGFFDFVVSNQVLEHVWGHHHFFSEHSRVLKNGGKGVHLFPLKHYIYEGHLHIPFVHRISDWHFLRSYIKFMSKLGWGKYKKEGVSLDDFSCQHADYMNFYTNYLSYSELFNIVKRSQLRPSLKYTADFYWHKLRQIFKRDALIDLGLGKRSGLLYLFLNHGFKYISSVTLYLEKDNTYNRA